MSCNSLMAIRIHDRDENAVKIQETLTRHGCNIRARVGLHDVEENNVCSTSGTLILQLCCTKEACKALEADLLKIEGVKAICIDLD